MQELKNWPIFAEDEQNAVLRTLRTGEVNYWTGNEGKAFESEFAEYHHRAHAIAVANGTVALELGLFAMGVREGDKVIVPSRTFIGTASSVAARGGIPVPADVDPKSQNLTVETIEQVISPEVKGVIVVHLAGWPCELNDIAAFCKEKGLFLIEDCAQAHGAKIGDTIVGSAGDCAAFSFCQDKIMSTGGEGGMLLIDDEELWKKAWSYKDHGKSFDEVYRKNHPLGFRWLHERFGTNWRMTEMQAAIGRLQLSKLESWVKQRRANAATLLTGLKEVNGLTVHEPCNNIYHSYYRFYAFLELEKVRLDWGQRRVLHEINKRGVPCSVGSCGEIYKEKAFSSLNKGTDILHKNAKQLFDTSLAFNVHPGISNEGLEYTISVVKRVLSECT